MESDHVSWVFSALSQFEGNSGVLKAGITVTDPTSPGKKSRRLKVYSNENYVNVRGLRGVSREDVQMALRERPVVKRTMRTETLLVHTGDERFVVKSVGRDEYEQLIRMSEAYLTYIQTHSTSLLVRILGVYKLKVYGTYRKTKLMCMLMDNVFSEPEAIEAKFDLKGSEFGRSSETSDLGLDLDFLNSGLQLHLGGSDFLAQLTLDVEFLQGQELFDYSLLVGIARKDRPEKAYSWQGSENRVYFLAVIDLASSYSSGRQLETAAKSLLFGETISCVPPEQYARRFLAAISGLVV